MPRAVPAEPIVSPCRKICRVDPARAACTSCGRTLDEIAAWGSGTSAWRETVMAALPARLAAIERGVR